MTNDAAYEAQMEANYGDSMNVKTFVPYDKPFQDASFYNPGAIANVWKGDRVVEIDVAGDLDISCGDTRIWKSEELRAAFPDGDLNLDEWYLENNRWFEFTQIINGQPHTIEGEVAFDYDEAIEFAKAYIEEDDLWI